MSPPAPSVAIIGAAGFIGRELMPTFFTALKIGEISSLHVLTRNAKTTVFEGLKGRGAKVHQVDYYNKDSVVDGLKGVDVLISAMGAKGDYADSSQVLVEAAVEAGVKIYVPSEWGTDHRRTKFKHPMLDCKQSHREYAEQLGLKVVAIYAAIIMETAFSKSYGFDSANSTWKIVGTGDNPTAMTSLKDLGPATLRTILLAYWTPQICPSSLRICSDNRTLNQYVDVMEKASGKKIKRIYIALEDALKEYKGIRETHPRIIPGLLISLMTAEGVYDYSLYNADSIINPRDIFFKWNTVNEYAKEVGGMPWENSAPWR